MKAAFVPGYFPLSLRDVFGGASHEWKTHWASAQNSGGMAIMEIGSQLCNTLHAGRAADPPSASHTQLGCHFGL